MSSKKHLEAVALESVQRQGLKSLSFRTLGAEVGIKSSSVHYHFPEKADLGNALIHRYRDNLNAGLASISTDSQSAHQSISEFVNVFFNLCKSGKICLGAMMAAEAEFLRDDNRENLSVLFNEMELWLLNEFKRGQPEMRATLPPDTMATVLLSAIEGATLVGRSERSERQLQSVLELVNSWFKPRGS